MKHNNVNDLHVVIVQFNDDHLKKYDMLEYCTSFGIYDDIKQMIHINDHFVIPVDDDMDISTSIESCRQSYLCDEWNQIYYEIKNKIIYQRERI